MEATYESMPQSILQLIYLMRTGTFSLVIGLSIIQSLASMTNSMLREDNSRGMQGTKWKKWKKRLPPTRQFLKHAVCRASQVVSRVATLSLLWTVVGGLGFSLVASFEVLCLIGASYIVASRDSNTSFGIENIFLMLNGIVILPPELIFSDPFTSYHIRTMDLFFPCKDCNYERNDDCMLVCCANYFAFVGMGKLLSTVCCSNYNKSNVDFQRGYSGYVWPSARL